MSEDNFVDYYQLLQVNPDCDARILEIAYHHFAKLYHPDNRDTCDTDKFGAIVAAYTALRDPETRADYDRTYSQRRHEPIFQFSVGEEFAVDDETAISDAEAHEKVLLALYRRRRENAEEPGIAEWFLQELVGGTVENFEFHIWYLKAKGYIAMSEQGTWTITVEGVDRVIAQSRSSEAKKLLSNQQKPVA